VRLDLDAVGLEGQAQAERLGLLDHVAAEGFPVEIRPGGKVGVVIAHGAIHLAQQLHAGDPLAGSNQAHHHVGQFLAHRGGAGGLAVGAAEHGHGGMGVCHVTQLGDDRVQRRQKHDIARALELQGVAGVVDVFAGAGEMHELRRSFQLWARFKSRLDPVLHRLDVVVGGFFDLLDGHGIGFAEVLHQPHQVGACAG
jgi:glutathione S-transferase